MVREGMMMMMIMMMDDDDQGLGPRKVLTLNGLVSDLTPIAMTGGGGESFCQEERVLGRCPPVSCGGGSSSGGNHNQQLTGLTTGWS